MEETRAEIVDRVISYWRPIIEKRLDELSTEPAGLPYPKIYDAMRYSLLDAGKRLRPVLALEFCRACSGRPEAALDCACAVEMIHTYSLIHDDLPCMDDDDYRRGKPSCHKAFDYATAMLAGDGLQALAAKTIADCRDLSADKLLKACAVLAENAGADGMVGGQELDLCSEGTAISEETLLDLVCGKTCALIEAACVIGCICAGADSDKTEAARKFAHEFGVAFQIIDDILDVTGDEKTLGKPVLSDEGNDKSTFVSIYGVERARQLAKEHTDAAVAALEAFDDAAFMYALADWQLTRIN